MATVLTKNGGFVCQFEFGFYDDLFQFFYISFIAILLPFFAGLILRLFFLLENNY